MRITLRQIRYFVALAETGKITLAGPAVNISSSAITEAVQALEAETGVKLVERHGKGIKLTSEGYKFLNHCRRILADVSEALHAMTDTRDDLGGRLRLAVSYAVAGFFLPQPLARFRRAHPEVDLDVREMQRWESEKAVAEGEADMAIMVTSNVKQTEELEIRPLLASRRRVWMASNHPLMQQDRVSIKDLEGEPYILLTIAETAAITRQFLSDRGITPNILVETSSIEAVRGMVAAGLGVSILSDLVYRPWSLDAERVEAKEIADPIPTFDIGAVWRRDRALPAPARSLLETVERFAEEQQR
jgi:DNA-binding transcriptional LysR family regulator